jgi:hypothetical protein
VSSAGDQGEAPDQKYYVILYNDTQMVYGIKALLNPHTGRPAFCAGQPNPLGGSPHQGEDADATLRREVGEETAGTFELLGDCQSFFHPEPGFEFFHSNQFVQRGLVWPSDLQRMQMGKDAREFCWIAVASKDDFLDHQSMTVYDIGQRLLDIAWNQGRNRYGSRQIGRIPSRGKKGYLGSHSSEAFARFITLWFSGALPIGGPAMVVNPLQ